MNTTSVVIMSVFAALVVLALVLGMRQSRRQRAQAQEFATARGWQYSALDRQLEARLESVDPATSWSVQDVVRSGNTSLFGDNSRAKAGRSSPDFGMACLVERSAPQITAPVMVTRRVPMIDKLLPQRVAGVGSEEFQKGYVVASSDPEAARRAVTNQVQRVLVEHDAGPAWVLTATLSASGIVVRTSWAKTPEEWDYLVRLTARLSQSN